MRIIRALLAFSVAASIPGIISILLASSESRPQSALDALVWMSVWYVFSLPITIGFGFAALLLSSKVPLGPIIVPPLVGGGIGALIAKVTYLQGLTEEGLILFSTSGLVSGVVAALIYYWPHYVRRQV